MYLGLLSLVQRQAFCQLGLFIITVDGEVDERELRLLDAAQREMELYVLPERPASMAKARQLMELFDTPLSRNVALLEAVGLALADRVIVPAEREVLDAMCAQFEIPTARIDEYREFASRILDLFEEGELLIARR